MHLKPNEMIKVLIFPIGTEIGNELSRSLQGKKNISLIGLNSIDINPKGRYDDIIIVPFIGDHNATSEVISTIQKIAPDVVFPAHDSATIFLSQIMTEGRISLSKLATSNIETSLIARSKHKTYEALKEIVPVPHVYHVNGDSSITFPLFSKPDIGQGSSGASIICNDADLDSARAQNLLVTEYLPGPEYTVDCFTTNSGDLAFVSGRLRKRRSNGISIETEIVVRGEFREYASAINERLCLKGPWFFQVKERQTGELVIMEIATRLAGSSGIHRFNGVNLSLAAVYNVLGYDIKLSHHKFFSTSRRQLSEHKVIAKIPAGCVLDYDDTLLQDGQINWMIVAIVRHLQSRGAWIDLVSRHGESFKEPLSLSLKKTNIPIDFRKVHDIPAETRKSSFTQEEGVIFVDDSFRERQEVASNSSAIVFDVNEFISAFGSLQWNKIPAKRKS